MQSEHQCAQKKRSTGCPACAESGRGCGPAAPRGNIQNRRGLAFERQQVDVLLDPGVDGSGTPLLQFGFQKQDGFIAPSKRREGLTCHLDRSTQRRGQADFRIKPPTRGELLQAKIPNLRRIVESSLIMLREQLAAPDP